MSNSNSNSMSNSNSNNNTRGGVLNVTITRPTRTPPNMFGAAAQPNILRAVEKDAFYLLSLQRSVNEVTHRLLGTHRAHSLQRFQQEIKVAVDLVYYGLTTLRGTQTLGEEYCDIVQVSQNYRSPAISHRTKLIFWQVMVPYILARSKTRLLNLCIARQGGPDGRVYVLLENLLNQSDDILDFIQKYHLAVFYFTGVYYELSKRMSGTRYVMNRKITQPEAGYGILGVFLLIQLLFSSSAFLMRTAAALAQPPHHEEHRDESESDDDSTEEENYKNCSLCLEKRKSSTSTACGHLYCWKCITEWCKTKLECPICRQKVMPQDLICVYNF